VPPADLAAIEERLGVPAAIRAALWTSRARAFRSAGKAAECREALDRAAALVPGYPALAYEEALLLDVRGEGEPAYQAYLKAVDGAVALKANPAGHTPLFLPRSLKDSIEPLIAAGARDLAWAAGEIGRAGGKDAEKESAWLLRRSTELDPEGPEGLRGRMEAFVKLDREEEALRVLDRLLTALSWDRPAAPRRAREIKALLGLKERLLEGLSRGEEAKRAREEIFKAPPRDPSLSPKLLDLSTHYNASLYDGRGWNRISGNVEASLKTLPESFEARGELRFDLRGLIQLNSGLHPPDCIWPEMRGKDMATGSQRPYPDALTGIKVGTRAASLHFVVSAIYCRLALTPAGTEVARFVVHYADGGQEVVPLLYAVDLVEWWFVREEFQLLDPSRVIWKIPAGDRQLDLKSWKNPRPDQTIESIDFVSAKKPCCPFLVAITAE
jgi:tetratricopeptide (TPR) repeat protein